MPYKAKLFSQGCWFGFHFMAQVFMTPLSLEGADETSDEAETQHKGCDWRWHPADACCSSVCPLRKNNNKKKKTGATSHMICSDTRQRWNNTNYREEQPAVWRHKTGTFVPLLPGIETSPTACVSAALPKRLTDHRASNVKLQGCACVSAPPRLHTQSQTIAAL